MATVDYRSLAGDILHEVGGEGNIAGATHCATRLRLKLRDEAKADKAAIEKLPGVITVMQAGGQYQIVIGDNVPTVYVFVLFGLHWGLVPAMLNEISTQGHSLLLGPLLSAVLAQAAATLAVFVRTRNKARRTVAGPAALSGFLAGITEPAIYGVNLPLKKPFCFGIAGGVVGGAIAAAGGQRSHILCVPVAAGTARVQPSRQLRPAAAGHRHRRRHRFRPHILLRPA